MGGGKKNFSWRLGGWLKCSPKVRVALQPRQETAEKPAPAPLPRQGSFPRRHAPRRPRHLGADPAGAEGERPGGVGKAGMRTGRSGRCLLDACRAPVAHPRLWSPRRLRAGAEARCWRSRRLEGAELTVARGRFNPLLPLRGLRKRGRWAGCERRRAQPARGRLGLLRPAASPPGRSSSSPPPQQFTCWSRASG